MTLSFRGPSAGAAAHNTNATQHKDEIDVSRAAARVCRFQGGSSHLSSEIVPITFFLPPQTFLRSPRQRRNRSGERDAAKIKI